MNSPARPQPRRRAGERAPVEPAAALAEPPRPFLDDYLAFLLAQASHRISGGFHREVESAGLSVTEWRVLASLFGGAHETIGTLSALVLVKQPTLSKVVQRMERQGLVTRCGTTADKRQTLVMLTDAGRAVAERHVRRALTHQAAVLKPLGTRNARLLITALRRLVELPK